MIVLSDEFYREISSRPIPTDLEAAKALSNNPAALDLFTWLSYRCFTARGRERVRLFGEFGPVSQLGSADYARPPEVPREAGRVAEACRGDVAGCPAHVDADGTGLTIDPFEPRPVDR